MHARHLIAAAIAAAPFASAFATDMASVPLPAPVADATLALGDRSVTLPPGHWTLVSREEGSIKEGVMHVRPHTTVYAADADGQRLRAGVVLRLAQSSVRVRKWIEAPCEDAKGTIFKAELSPEHNLPECIAVWKRKSHLAGSALSPFYAAASQWMDATGVRHDGSFYEIFYARNAANDFGSVRAFVPAATFATDADAIAWAKQVPGALQRVFERRENTGALPPLPTPPKP